MKLANTNIHFDVFKPKVATALRIPIYTSLLKIYFLFLDQGLWT